MNARFLTSADPFEAPAAEEKACLFSPADPGARQLIRMGPRMSVASEIAGDEHRFVLNSPLKIDVSYEEGGVFTSHKVLPVSGYGSSLREALVDFDLMFEVQWEALVNCNPRDLAPSGIKGRDALVAAVKEVEPLKVHE